MKQNQVITSRLQVGGRSVPHFFPPTSKDVMRRPSDTLPPPPPQSQPTNQDESEYEEIDHLPRYTNTPGKRLPGSKKVCSLCGASNPVVRCDMCNSQIFCGPCNDMYHRHPKRHNHIRTLLEVVEARPPLPPRSMSISDPPIRPPRRQKKFGIRSTTSSPTSSRKALFDQFPGNFRSQFSDGMDHRPLPPPPLPRSEPPFHQNHDFHPNSFNSMDRRHGSSSQLHQPTRNIPLTVLEMSSSDSRNRWNPRPQDFNRFNDIPPQTHHHDHTMSNQIRAQSASTSQLNRFLNTSANLSHIATLSRKPKRPIVCGPVRPPPPPIPPREQLPHQSFHSASAFDLNKMSLSDNNPRTTAPWMHPHFHHQQHPSFSHQGYPYPHDQGFGDPFQNFATPHRPSLMKRASSSSSMTNMNQPVFNPWSTFNSPHPEFFDDQENPMEFMEFRRGSAVQLPPYSNHMVTNNNFHQPRSPRPYIDQQPPPPPRPITRESTPRRDHSRHPSVFNDRQLHSDRERSATPASRRNPSQPWNPQPFREVPGTPPPPGAWQCEWCTLVNPPDAKICSVCCKTPSSVLKASNQSLQSLGLPHDKKSSKEKRSAPKPPRTPPPKSSAKRDHKNGGALVKSTLSFSRQKEKVVPQVEKHVLEPSDQEDSDDDDQKDPDDDDEEDDEDDDEDQDGPPPTIFPSTPSTSESETEFPPPRPHHFRSRKAKSKRQIPPSSSSNEEVYGSLPLQTLSIPTNVQRGGITSQDFLEPRKTTSTAVGSSPPSPQNNFPEPFQSNHGAFVKVKDRSSENSSQSSSKGTMKPALKKPVAVTVESTPPAFPDQSYQPPVSEIDKITTSKGTSPPPQSISTQTYEELPRATTQPVPSSSKANSTASTAVSSSIENLLETSPSFRSPKEMSDKELRYSRRAQQQSKLKRSMSTHLTSSSHDDPWMEGNEGRHLWRSSSRHSLASDTRSLPISGPPSRDSSPPRGSRYFQDFRNFPPPSWDRFPTNPADYFASIEGFVNRRRRDSTRHQEIELTYLLKEAAEYGFSPEEVQIALRMSGNENPVKWLKDNWNTMVETVQTLATNFGREKGDENNDVGTISNTEAREALRLHKGNVWASITDCVEQRRTKFMELRTRGNFLREDILTALTVNHGKLDAAYVDLSKAQLKPFLMHIWGPPIPADNEAAPSRSSRSSGDSNSASNFEMPYMRNMPDFSQKQQHEPQSPLQSSHPSNFHQNPTALPQNPQPFSFSQNNNSKIDSPAAPGATILSHNPTANPPYQTNQQQPLTRLQDLHMHFPALEVSPDDIPELERMEMEQINDPDALPVHMMDNKLHLSMDAVLELLEHQRTKILQEKLPPPLAPSSNPSEPSTAQLPHQPPPPPPHQSQPSTSASISHHHGTTQGAAATLSQSLPASKISEIPKQPELLIPEPPVALPGPSQMLPGNPKSEPIAGSSSSSSHPPAQQTSSGHTNNNAPALLTDSPAPVPGSTVKLQLPVAADIVNVNLEASPQLSPPLPSPAQLQKPPSDVPLAVASNVAQTLTTVELTPEGEASTSSQVINVVLEIVNPALVVGPPEQPQLTPTLPLESTQKTELTSDVQTLFQNFMELHDPQNHDETLDILDMEDFQDENEIEIYQIQDPEIFIDEEDMDSDDDNYETQSDSSNISPEEVSEQVTEISLPAALPKETISEPPKPKPQPEPLNKMATQVRPITSQVPAKVVKEMKPTVRRLLESGLSDSFENAELAAQLMDMKFTEEDSVIASKECSSINAALSYLHQECHLCAGKFSAHQMISMLRCTHWCCKTCAKDYFIVQIRDRGILDATCPFCKEPSNLLDESDQAAEYFNHLDILLKNLLEDKYHEMFQRKLRDWALSKTPNFKWCSKCSSGFITEPLQTRLVCPDCSAVTCAVCLEPWDRTHDHPDQKEVTLCDVAKSVVDYLNENSVECPRCRTKFALARGGCMHLTCSHCKFEFCSGCSAAFRQADKCNNGPFCLKLGLHAHHPRNCLFYLRDKDPPFLAKLLQENSIPYLSEQVIDISQTDSHRKCHVSIQKETEDGLVDDICGIEAPQGFANVCKGHYVEYLGLLIWQNHLDPVSILSNDDLETIIRRAHKKVPPRPYGTKDADFRIKLLEVIQNEIPL